MTIIKQKAVAHERHANNLRDYINDKDALLRDTQNLVDEQDWFEEMDEIREAAGHNKPAKEGAKNVILYHQIIAFLPEEADINGGKMSPSECMRYARQYAEQRYPDYQIAFALHKERCKEDGTYRYAVHMAINRTNLETGKRLAEGRGEIAKIDRARTIRELDAEWGLQQVEKDKPNSKIHKRQPRGAEKEITQRGEKSYKHNLRRWCDHAEKQSDSLTEFCKLLESVGYRVTTTNNKVFVVDLDHETNKQGNQMMFNLSKLDGRFSKQSLEQTFAASGMERSVKQNFGEIQQREFRVAQAKASYQEALQKAFRDYQQSTLGMQGRKRADIPAFRAPRLPQELQDDMQSKQLLLEYRNRADRLRGRLASDVATMGQQGKNTGKTKELSQTRSQEQQSWQANKEK